MKRVFLLLLLLGGVLNAQDTIFFNKEPLKPNIYKSVRYDGEFYYLETNSSQFFETKAKPEDIYRIGYFIKPKKEKAFDPRTNDSLRTEEYCLIVGTTQLFSTKVTITIDYGQERSFWDENRMTDENGDVIKFNSLVDALTFMNGLGWEFVSAYPMISGQGTCYHYLMKRSYKKNDGK
jgi:hypothetical protein